HLGLCHLRTRQAGECRSGDPNRDESDYDDGLKQPHSNMLPFRQAAPQLPSGLRREVRECGNPKTIRRLVKISITLTGLSSALRAYDGTPLRLQHCPRIAL